MRARAEPPRPDEGSATIWAALLCLVVTGTALAALAFAVILYKVITSGFVTDLLKDLVHKALTMVS